MDATAIFQLKIGLFAFSLAAVTLLLTKTRILDVVLNAWLNFVYKFTSEDSTRSMKGPEYKFPNGNMQEKFLQARQKSVEWEAQYGPVYRIWMGMNPEVIITNPDDVRAFYHEATDHNKSHLGNLGWLISEMMAAGAGLINGQKWKTLRKTMDPMFSHKAAVQLLQDFDKSAASHVQKLFSFSQVVNSQKAQTKEFFIINAAQALQRYPFFTTAEIFFGELSSEEEEDLWRLSKLYNSAFINVVKGGINRSRLTKFLGTTAWAQTTEYTREWNAFLQKMIQRTSQTRPDTPLNRMWVLAQKGEISELEVVHTVAESLFANLDITTHVLASSTLLLADNAKVQNELRAEFVREQGDLQSYLSRKDTLLHYCLLEALRLQPVISFSFPEHAPRAKVLGGFVVPKNTTVIVDAHSLNIRNPFWGKDSRQYRPERFASIPPSVLRYNMSTFGYGPRKCLGQHISDKMLKSFLYHLFTRYEVNLQPNQILDGEFKYDKTSWVALFDVELGLRAR
ncbi:cytochrome P450 monooxygenase GliC2 [Bisporella sp. PMI_857]|nr:cytochrome P450 monooxygenase GliC2 [Bisporella sp. PMI_857]